MKILLNYTVSELAQLLTEMGEPAFRAKQIYLWLYKGSDIDGMSNLPASLREKLKKEYVASGVTILKELISGDGTRKYLFSMLDGNIVEGVLMKYKYGYTICVSTQVGCRMGCRFCASTLNGLVRNLTSGEILGQVIAVNRTLGDGERRISNIVLMGSGEPLDNYDETLKFLRCVNDPCGLGISIRNISLSTCGLADKIYRLADEGGGVTLSISLHAPNDEIRKQTMPIANKYKISDIMSAARAYVEKTGRRVIFEYALIDGVNDTDECVNELARLLQSLQCHVNLIPLNSVKERELRSSRNVRRFAEELGKRNISCSIRREMGSDISGACGQLRAGYLKENAL